MNENFSGANAREQYERVYCSDEFDDDDDDDDDDIDSKDHNINSDRKRAATATSVYGHTMNDHEQPNVCETGQARFVQVPVLPSATNNTGPVFATGSPATTGELQREIASAVASSPASEYLQFLQQFYSHYLLPGNQASPLPQSSIITPPAAHVVTVLPRPEDDVTTSRKKLRTDDTTSLSTSFSGNTKIVPGPYELNDDDFPPTFAGCRILQNKVLQIHTSLCM